jgi:predicted DNA-binding transcriptional regulator AlpA
MKLESRLHTSSETARVLGLTVSGLRRMCEEGRGPTITRIGRLVRFTPDAILAFIAKSQPEAAGDELPPVVGQQSSVTSHD